MEKCWFCETNDGSGKHNIKFDLYKIISEESHIPLVPLLTQVTKTKFKQTSITVPRCRSCARERRKANWISGLFITPMSFLSSIGTYYILEDKYNVHEGWSLFWSILSFFPYAILFMIIFFLIYRGLIRLGIVIEDNTNMIPGRSADDYPKLVKLKKEGWKLKEPGFP